MRECGSCTKCCEGWLEGKVNEHQFYRGRPCFYLKEISCTTGGCSIYDTRPETPCKSYSCVWVTEDVLPEWMKPNLVNLICSKRIKNNISYYEFTEAGSMIDAVSLNWILMWAINYQINIVYHINGGFNCLGSVEFLNIFDKKVS